MLTPRYTRPAIAVAAVLLVCGMSGPAVAQQDLRMPDTRDAATAATHRQDLRSPDTRDVADGRKYPATPTVVTLKEIKAPESVPTTGFDWVAAVAGAAATFGVILLMAAALVVTRRRARRGQPVAAS